MSIHIIIHKHEVNNSHQIDFNEVKHFAETDFKALVKKIDDKIIILDYMGSFFVQDIISKKLFRIYFQDFRYGYQICGFPTMQEYTEDLSSIIIVGTIEFK